MSLDDIVAEMRAAHARGEDVARLHSGDISIWSAMGEQIRALREHGVPYTVTPGVPSFSAAAAALGAELTLPGACQSVVLTRTSGRASQMPSGENLAAFAATGAVLAIHLSVHVAEQVQAELLPHYGADCPAAIVWRASWGDETIVRTRVGEIAQAAQANPLQRSALILVGATLAQEGFGFSRLYADDYDRRWRPRGDEPRFPVPDADEPAHGDGEPRASTPDEVPATSQAREGGRADA
jgi:precorrin-4/cobalt-precorrin-4 C11-methyltransferase